MEDLARYDSIMGTVFKPMFPCRGSKNGPCHILQYRSHVSALLRT